MFIITLAGISSASGLTTSSAACNFWNTTLFFGHRIRIDASIKSQMIRMDVSHDSERCGVDFDINDTVSFGYRSFRH